MNQIQINLPIGDWVWLCEFLSQLLKEGELDPYCQEDTQRILDLLQYTEKGIALTDPKEHKS